MIIEEEGLCWEETKIYMYLYFEIYKTHNNSMLYFRKEDNIFE